MHGVISSLAKENAWRKNTVLKEATNRNVFARGARHAKIQPHEEKHVRSPRPPRVVEKQTDLNLVEYAGLDSLQNTLLEHKLEWAICESGEDSRRTPEKVKDLHAILKTGVNVLSKTESTMSMQSGHIHIQLVYDSRALVVTHERLQHQCAKVVTHLPSTVRNMHTTLQQGVEHWFIKNFDLDSAVVAHGIKLSGITEVSSTKEESQQFPGITRIHKVHLVTLTVNAEVQEIMDVLGLPECYPITLSQSGNCQDAGLICSWWPEHLLPYPIPKNAPAVIKAFNVDKRMQFVSEILKGTLGVDPDAVCSMIWNPPTDSSMLISVVPPANRLFGEPLVLAHIMFQGGVDKHGELKDRYHKMKQVVHSNCARLVHVHKFEDRPDTRWGVGAVVAKQSIRNKEGSLVELALDHACWDAPEISAGLRVSVAVLEDVFRMFFINHVDSSKGLEDDVPPAFGRQSSIESDQSIISNAATAPLSPPSGGTMQHQNSFRDKGQLQQHGTSFSQIAIPGSRLSPGSHTSQHQSNFRDKSASPSSSRLQRQPSDRAAKDGNKSNSENSNSYSEHSGNNGPALLVSALTVKLSDIIKKMAGPAGILSQLMSHPERKQHTILDIYQTNFLLMQHAIKKNPGVHAHEQHNPFNTPLSKILDQIDIWKRDDDPEQPYADPVSRSTASRALEVLKQLHEKLQQMQDSHKWRKDCWRPLGCLAHGDLSCSNLLVDGFASVWLYNYHEAGLKPVWVDVAKLSLSMLVDCCILPISFDQLVLLTGEMWVTAENLAQWLKVDPQVAEVLLAECVAEAEVAKKKKADASKRGAEEDAVQVNKETGKKNKLNSNRETQRSKTRRRSSLIEGFNAQQNRQDSPSKDSPSRSRTTLIRDKTPEAQSDNQTDSAPTTPSDGYSKSPRGLGKIKEDEDEKSKETRKVLRVLERAAAADPLRPSHEVFRVLQAQIVISTTEAHRCLEELYEFADAWVAQLDVRKYSTYMEAPNLTGHRKELWDLQKQLLEEAIASYGTVLRQLASMTPSIKVMPVDTSPILIELPLLDGALKHLSSPSVAPWRKNFVCALVAALGNRILQEVKTMEAPPVAVEPPLPPPVQHCRRVHFAPGHRMLMGTDFPNDDPKCFTGEVIPITVGDGAARFGTCVPWGDISLEGPMALLGWPCSGYGITIDEFVQMRRESEVDNPDVNICHQYDVATRTRLSAAGPYAQRLRKQPWPDEFSGNACSGCFQVVGVEYDKAAGGQVFDVCVEDVGVGLLLKDVQRDDLLVHGRRVGWAAVGQCLVMDCPRKSAHAKATKQMPLHVYNRFPCTGCGRIMHLSEASTSPSPPGTSPSPTRSFKSRSGTPSSPERCRSALGSVEPPERCRSALGSAETRSPDKCRSAEPPVDTQCVHCHECWGNHKRFDLCNDCVRTRVPICQRRHQMVKKTESPYDGEPHCRRCQKKIPPFPAWDEPESTNKQTMEVPRWYHCRHCHQEQNPPFDLCADCSYVMCPLGHKMHVLNKTRSSLMGKCHHCGKGGGVFNILHCISCQDMRHEVVYPSVDAARLDFQLSASNNKIAKNAGLIVTAIKRGGAAALAGVHVGYRLVSVNKRQVKGPVEFAYVGVRGAVLAEFTTPLCAVLYEEAKDILKDITLQKAENALIVTKVTFGGKAAQNGVGRGCRLLSINDKTIEKLRWDGQSPLSSVTQMAPPFYCSFQPRGSELIYHEGCGIACDHGHFMEPQYPPFVCCEEGHPMQRKLKSALKLTENDCCDFCDQVLVDDPDPCVMYCGQCTRDIGTSKEPRRSSFGHEKIQMKERVTLPTMPTVHRASFGGVGQAVNVRGSLVHTARASVTGQHSEEGPAKPVSRPSSARPSSASKPALARGQTLLIPGASSVVVTAANSASPSRVSSRAASPTASPRASVNAASVMSMLGGRTSFADVAQKLLEASDPAKSRPSVMISPVVSRCGSRESTPESLGEDWNTMVRRSLTPVQPRAQGLADPRAPRRRSLPDVLSLHGAGGGRRNSFGGSATKAIAATQQNRLLCRECAVDKYSMQKNKIPYWREGTVQCSDCGRTDLGRPNRSKEQNPNIPFFHCKQCYESPTGSMRFDVCLDCVGHHLTCDNEDHLMVQCNQSPYLCKLQCAVCTRTLPLDERNYHCDTCWWQDGVQLDRCSKCAERQKVEVALDETARFQLLSKEAPLGNLVWEKSVAPMAKIFAAGAHLLIRLQLRGFVYPPFARLQVQTDGREREATLCGPPLANGKYELRYDGEDEPFMLDPDLTNHIPAAVFRYSPSQKLSVYTCEHGWLDVMVLSVAPEGNGHLVEVMNKDDICTTHGAEAFEPWHMILNTWNHAPLWLDTAQWIQQRRIWNEQLLVTCSGAADVITGRKIDVMSLMWNLRVADGETNMWMWLMTLVSESSERHRGMHHNAGVVILGPPGCGKTHILKRMVVECIKDPMHEIVPLLIDAIVLVQTFGGAEKCMFRLKQLCFLDSYLGAAYGAGSKTYLFLLQALCARRVLILVDGFEKLGKDTELQEAILENLEKLRASGHRIVVPLPHEQLPPGKQAERSKRLPTVALPKAFQCLWVVGFNAEQRQWLAETRLGEEVALPFLESLKNFQADIGQLLSTSLMFQLFLNTAEMKLEEHRIEAAKLTEERRKERELKQKQKIEAAKAALMKKPEKASDKQVATAFRRSYLKSKTEADIAATSPKGSESSGEETPDEEEALNQTQQAVRFEDNVSEALGTIINKTLRSLAMGKDAHQAPHVQNLFQSLALKMLQSSSYTFNEKDIVDVSRSDPRLLDAWRCIEDLIQRGRVSTVITADALNKRGRMQSGFRFSHPCIQHSLASRAIVARWGQMSAPVKSMEQALTEPRTWEPVIRWMAPLMKGPIALKMIECVEEHAIMLQDFVSRSSAVNGLTYAGTNVGQCWKTLQHVCNACRQNSALAQLDLSFCGLGSTGAQTLCNALQQHPRVEVVNLKDNLLGLIGAQAVSEMLCINRSIRTLDLSINSIGDMGAHALSDALVENQILGSLNLQQNNISTEACKSLNSAVLLTAVYRVVDARYNRKDVPDFFVSVAAGPNTRGRDEAKGLQVSLQSKERKRSGNSRRSSPRPSFLEAEESPKSQKGSPRESTNATKSPQDSDKMQQRRNTVSVEALPGRRKSIKKQTVAAIKTNLTEDGEYTKTPV